MALQENTSVVARLRATACALRADAEERATQLDAAADEIERGADALVTVEAGAESLGVSVRQLRDDLRRRGVSLEKVGATSFVRRSALTRAAAPKASPAPALSPREAARAAVAARAAGGGR
ncbi:MAG: hypothetical protein NVS3B10_30430 [Polyangiales bacterium]